LLLTVSAVGGGTQGVGATVGGVGVGTPACFAGGRAGAHAAVDCLHVRRTAGLIATAAVARVGVDVRLAPRFLLFAIVEARVAALDDAAAVLAGGRAVAHRARVAAPAAVGHGVEIVGAVLVAVAVPEPLRALGEAAGPVHTVGGLSTRVIDLALVPAPVAVQDVDHQVGLAAVGEVVVAIVEARVALDGAFTVVA